MAPEQAGRRHGAEGDVGGPAPRREPVLDPALAQPWHEDLARDQDEDEHSDGDPCPAKHPESLGDGRRNA